MKGAKNTPPPPADEEESTLELKPIEDFKPKPKKEGNVPGFEDHDGDGNEIIDDAIIDDDDDNPDDKV